MTNCDMGSTLAKPLRVTKPTIFDPKALFVRLRPGVRQRMDALRGKQRIGDFARELLEEALEAREAKRKP
jgi:hypothetical protein